ncbi:phosphotransferase family protein [Hydrogenophaga laconesensis]|uniref:Aminoglycoside phosphotransferase (APT) family kinase protein n=1 Tax=Hydrogenophaga laconesensis TaxID=1805971 RepID=A0ABU1V6Y4_9BURK|nr:phosphotransferase family protein [Hydrogenophaga laconesensis]MDR7093098.1 aminoglycoside phosphotransferase (APT) family kinase protein [Hydrogenophaga laconesensis]
MNPVFDPAAPELAARLQSWLSDRWQKPVAVVDMHRFPAGMSWVTIGFVAASLGEPPLELILRVGDPGGLFSPYSSRPEYEALAALASVPGLPIPKAYEHSDDPGILGAPFVITQRVPGDTPTPWGGAHERGEAVNRSLGRDFADALGAIHAFDWTNTPLAAWVDDSDGTITPQTTALHETRHWTRHARLGLGPTPPQMHYAMHWLEANAPEAERITIVHGDYRVGNFLQQDGRITAILDWELVHLGDPHADLAWAGLRTFAAGTTRIGGLIERDEFYRRWEARTGLRVRPEKVRYYEVMVQFKMASMLMGAMIRVQAGRSRDVRMAAMGFQLTSTLMELNKLIAEAG